MVPHFFLVDLYAAQQNVDDGDSVAMSMIDVPVSVANSFVYSCTAAGDGYHSFRELAHLIYCLLQKIETASSLPLVEQFEELMTPDHSQFPAIDEKAFLSGIHLMNAPEKVGSHYLRTEFRGDARRFLEEIVKCLMSTVASRSLIGQGMSCLCPAIVVGEDDVALLQLFKKLLDGLLEKGWTRGGKI